MNFARNLFDFIIRSAETNAGSLIAAQNTNVSDLWHVFCYYIGKKILLWHGCTVLCHGSLIYCCVIIAKLNKSHGLPHSITPVIHWLLCGTDHVILVINYTPASQTLGYDISLNTTKKHGNKFHVPVQKLSEQFLSGNDQQMWYSIKIEIYFHPLLYGPSMDG